MGENFMCQMGVKLFYVSNGCKKISVVKWV